MTKREKIIKVLKKVDKYHYIPNIDIECFVDEILAIPLDTPSSLEIINAERAYPMKTYPYSNIKDLMANADKVNTAGKGFRDGVRWAIEQVIERNQK